MIQKITGIITDVTPLGTITTKAGKKKEKCILHIRTADSDPNKAQEIAVTLHGDKAKFRFCMGMLVVVEYVIRVFSFLKNNKRQLGNDIYCTSIKSVNHEHSIQEK